MLINELSDNQLSEWAQFLKKSNNGTIFHDLKFLAYHPPNKFNTCHLIFRKNNKEICAIMPAALTEDGCKVNLCSPYGASVGGFVFGENILLEESTLLVESLINYAKEKSVSTIILTTPPLIYQKIPHQQIEFALFINKFKYIRRLLISALDLASIEKDPMDVFEGRLRTAIRKAIKLGVTVRESEQYGEFYKILVENKQRHGALPTHTLGELLDLHKRLPDKIKLFLAYMEGIPIAGVLIFICNERIALTFYICHLIAYQNHNAVSLILYEVVKKFKGDNFKYLDLGPSVGQDMKIGWGVLRFKESLNTRGYFRDTWQLDLQ